MQDPANGQLYGDSLYGLSWAVTLHLVPQLVAAGLRIDRVQSHLRAERKINLTPYGLRFSSPLPPNTTFSCPSIPTPSRRQNGFYAENDIWPAASASCDKTVVLSNLYISAIISPSQARDKHRENSKKTIVFSGGQRLRLH